MFCIACCQPTTWVNRVEQVAGRETTIFGRVATRKGVQALINGHPAADEGGGIYSSGRDHGADGYSCLTLSFAHAFFFRNDIFHAHTRANDKSISTASQVMSA